MGIRIINGRVVPFEDIGSSKISLENDIKENSFKNFLKEEINKKDFKISAHALERLKERNITLGEEDFNKINDAINLAQGKNCKDCLILYKNMALITSIKNRTLITALDKENMQGNIITNIDSTVIL